jgi:hypothetical protein
MIIRGNETPPRPPAVQATPVARPRRSLNQWEMAETLGLKRSEEEMPPRTPKERRKCQNSTGGQCLRWK